MAESCYAVVNYLPGKIGEFVDRLRRRFDPALAAWLAHVTILPPRPLLNPVEETLDAIRRRSAAFDPFDATLQGASTFWPVSGVVHLSFSAGSERLQELHGALNLGALAHQEQHPYTPHVTIAQELDEATMQAILAEVRRELSLQREELSFRVASLFLVQHTAENRWIDLAPISLGSPLASSRTK